MRKGFLDTNVYVDWINRGVYADVVTGPGLVRYLSAVVRMELRVGTTSRSGARAVEALVRAYDVRQRTVVPTLSAFDRAGEILRKLRATGVEIRRASIVNDVLIAASAREMGAVVFTGDADFETIRRIEPFALERLDPV